MTGEHTHSQECDVFVVGGGPGGSATAALLARRGFKVVIAEKEHHPRFHVGESLLPFSLPLLEDLGVLERVRGIGVHKNGAEFITPCGSVEQVFDFSRALLSGPGHAYQVRRAEFDAILFDGAVEAGARPLQDTLASVVHLGEDHAIVKTSTDGEETTWRARFLVDASGRSTLLAKHLGEKRADPRNDSAAIFGHFRNVYRPDGARAGNIRLFMTDPGWMWCIPLPNGITSMGLVAPQDYLAERQGAIEPFFRAHVARHPGVAHVLEHAVVENRMRATGNFSYRADTAWGSSHIKVGDSFGFLDPIFSSGVHLALSSAQDAADAVETTLTQPVRGPKALAAYEKRARWRMDHISWFILKIRDPAFRRMMVNPKNYFGLVPGIISILAGDMRRDPRLTARVLMFKFFHFITRLGMALEKDRGQVIPGGANERSHGPAA